MVDISTCYQNTAFTIAKTADDLEKVFVDFWASVYCGFLDVLRIDREPSFMVAPFRDVPEGLGVIMHAYNIENHNAIGVGEI